MNLKSIQQFEDPFRVNRDFTQNQNQNQNQNSLPVKRQTDNTTPGYRVFTHGGKWACAFGGKFTVSLTREFRLKLFIADVRLINSVRFGMG